MESSIVALPPECLYHIFSFIPLFERQKLRKVCQTWCDITDHSIQILEIHYPSRSSASNRPPQTISDNISHSIILNSASQVTLVDSLLNCCGRHLTSFTENRKEDCRCSLSKSIHVCENVQELNVVVQSETDEHHLSKLFNVNRKIKRLSLIFRKGRYYKCLQYLQTDELHDLIIIRQGLFDLPQPNKITHIIDVIRNAKSLKTLSCNDATEEEIKAIGEKLDLRTLRIDGRHLDQHSAGLSSIFNLKNLTTLIIAGRGKLCFTDDIMAGIAANCQQLRSITITSAVITDKSIQVFAKLPHLQKLTIFASPHITDEFLWYLEKVEHLNVQYCYNVRDCGVIKLLHRSLVIQSLVLAGTNVTNSIIIPVANEEVKKRRKQVPLILVFGDYFIPERNFKDKSPLLTIYKDFNYEPTALEEFNNLMDYERQIS